MTIQKLRPTFTFTEDRLRQLQQVVPEAFADGKINWDALREALGEHLEDETQEHFGLTWPGKREARLLAALPPQGTLVPAPGEGIDEATTHNVFIEGENLEVLKLLQKSYAGRVKLIYIDPPYNTGNDFVYEDDYSEPLETYLKRTGQMDEAGRMLTTNPRASGRFHSRWLSMIYPRLLLARQLLREDGVIFVSIDDNEVHHLRQVMNEVFGEECFKNIIVIRRGIKNVQAQFDTIDRLTIGHEYIIFYSKDESTRFRHFLTELDESRGGSWNNHWRGTDRPTMRYELFGITPSNGQWRWSKERSLIAIQNYENMARELGYSPNDNIPQEEIDKWYMEAVSKTGEDIDLLRLSKNNKPEHYVPPSASKVGSDLWIDLPFRDTEVTILLGKGNFNNPKPVELIKRIIKFTTGPDSIILDFFAGSSTTAHAVLVQNLEDDGRRQFIMVQLSEPTRPNSEACKAGYATIAEVGKERIRRVIRKMKEEAAPAGGQQSLPVANEAPVAPLDLGFKVFKLARSHFKPWTPLEPTDTQALDVLFAQHTSPLVEGWTKDGLLSEILLLEGFPLDSQVIRLEAFTENVAWRVHHADVGHDLFVCLDEKIQPATIERLKSGAVLGREDLFICLDSALTDQAKVALNDLLRLKVI